MTETTTGTRTPVVELRAAATKLRETATSPLECINPLIEGQPDEWTKYYGGECYDLPQGDGPWIALMSPELAEPLAAWLESIAEEVERHQVRGWDARLTPLAGGHSLAVARAINRSAS